MPKITDTEVDFILDDITRRGIETEDVRYNILDHVCCIIENEMPFEMDFYKCYEDTIARFYKKDLAEIELETRDLITFKYYYAMKRTLKITGFVSIVLILIGSILKFQHLPGAGVCLFSGLIFFSLIFLPLNIIMKFRDDKEKSSRLIMTLGMVLAITGSLGVIFKVMHWPWANILFYGSFLAFFAVFIPVFFITRYRNVDTRFNAIVQSTFMVAACGMLFALVNLGPSVNIETSVHSMAEFKSNNLQKIETNNANLYANLQGVNKISLQDFMDESAQLKSKLTGIYTNLFALSNNIPFDQAKGKKAKDLKHPNDFKVVNSGFDNANSEYSYSAFLAAVDQYNLKVAAISGNTPIEPIELGELQMTNTIVSVVLHELMDIQMQVLMNESAMLNYQNGVLAAK
ncbi:APC family permease [Crocinitomix catalasitica]|uniref:hypothetical protein n=1 Tax=Crocinitomix catalasitica TaxID=184607 RepID=UPI00056B3AFE|nr:hypothetical protein [Crocinitomix catalasitica]